MNQIKAYTWWGVVEFLLKHIRDPDITPAIIELIPMLMNLEKDVTALRFFETAFRYLLTAGVAPDLPKVIAYAVQSIEEPELREKAMTIADMLREEGLKEGRKEGIVKGKKIIVKNMLSKGCHLEFIAEMTGLSLNQVQEMKAEHPHKIRRE